MAVSKNQIRYIRQLEQKKFRHREGLFVAEGTKVVGDLLAHYQPHSIFATPEWLDQHAYQFSTVNCQLYSVSPDELSRISFQQHPQQVLALFPIPDSSYHKLDSSWQSQATKPSANLKVQSSYHKVQSSKLKVQSLNIALDGIQDPGNLGTIIRIADWFGITDIFCSEDTVDAWNPKEVQATMGSIARVHILYCDLSELIDSLPEDFPVYGTLLDGDNIYTQSLTPNGLIVMGNEGNGISPEIRAKVNRRLLIPSYRQDDTAESLNVAIATAITCSEFRRRNP